MAIHRHEGDPTNPPDATPDRVRDDQIASYARQTPINALVTLSVSLVTALVLWPVAPRAGVLGWLGLHYALALFVVLRWKRRSPRPSGRPRSGRAHRRAKLWAAISGTTWGASVGFFPFVDPTVQVFLILVVGGMAAGASTTLAAIPGAAVWYILSSILPFSLYLLLQGDPVYFGLALMGIVLAFAMLGSTRVVYRSFIESVRARRANAALLARFEQSRREWLEISETAEGFALFDAGDRLLLWNDNYQRVLSLPDSALSRGAPRHELLEVAARPTGLEGEAAVADWIASQLRAGPSDEPVVEELTNGRWIGRHARRTADGHTVTSHVDVTELKRAEAALYESRRKELLGQLTGGFAHDFNNLLTVILGNLELLKMRLEEPEALARVDRAVEAALAGSNLTQRLLAFAKRQPLSSRPTDVRALVDEAARLVRRTLGDSYDVRTSHPPELPLARVDPTQLANALLHLGLNARDAMPAGGELVFETGALAPGAGGETLDPFVTISVRDQGAGMTPEVRARAFEPFFTTKEVGQGSGLGLSMVHGFVEQSGGRIEVESEEGVSTTVKLYLPRSDEADAGVSTSPVSDTSRDRCSGATVLVVEDSDEVREYAVRVLREAGNDVLEAPDGARAIELLDEHAGVDLLFTDVLLPGELSGRDVAHALRERRPESRVLYTSGYSRDVFLEDGEPEHDVELLQKPYSPDALLARVRSILGR